MTNNRKMQMRPLMSSRIKLKTALVYGTSIIAIANLIGFMVASYAHSGISDSAHAASLTNSYVQVADVNLTSSQFTVESLSQNPDEFQPGKTVLIYQLELPVMAAGNMSGAVKPNAHWEFASISSVEGSGPYTITVSSLKNNYSTTANIQLISVPDCNELR